jgi:hypothetical protein
VHGASLVYGGVAVNMGGRSNRWGGDAIAPIFKIFRESLNGSLVAQNLATEDVRSGTTK